jgi:hypothetical protein
MSVVDIATGRVTTTVPIGAGVDALRLCPVTKYVFCSNGDGTTMTSNRNRQTLTRLFKPAANAGAGGNDGVRKKTHKIYLSVADFQQGTRNVIPDTFTVLVYK